jgi:hypothetical protein
MAKNPDQRFANGDAYIAALDRLLMDHPQADFASQQSARKRNTLKSFTPLPGSVPAANLEGAPRKMSMPMMAGIGAAVLVLVIGAGWFFMHRSSPENTIPVVAPTPQPSLPSPQPTIEQNQATAAMMKLDLPTLLSKANDYLAYGTKNFGEKLDFPPGDNAIDMYREVLRRDSSNAVAKQGLAQIAGYYEQAARDALKQGLYTATDEFIDKGLRADPNSENLAKLKTELASKEKSG